MRPATQRRGMLVALLSAVLLTSIAVSASAAWLVRAQTSVHRSAVLRGAGAWRVERPLTARPVKDDGIPTLDVSELRSEP